jgi:hypothetical protein
MWFIVKLEKELEMCGLAKLFLCGVTLPNPVKLAHTENLAMVAVIATGEEGLTPGQ